ncbi:hypothetical protein [Actinoplanes flavus]|uniref:Uncharacterized protein n=1 Tax=Actinoplanes flavus TaxID=2820290 RepID=A0ABS3UQ41_9ACTN|nr:hypothetical protein [Actinoplanes flavus]MBO3740877.1 hypothetical protein [Actinoplanes flavus]
MRPLSELLHEAKVDGPPPRYDVDHVVAAGRRRVRRRNSEWAFAAVVAVAAAIGVPQVVTRGPAPAPPQPAASVAPAPAPEYLIPSVARFRGYQTASFRVGDPGSFGPGYTSVGVVPKKGMSPTMSLLVYEPGVDPLTRLGLKRVADVDPIKGRPAFTVSGAGFPSETLVWEYADNAYAVLTPEPPVATNAQVREVADGFGIAPEQPVRIPFKLGHVPDGFRLRAVSQDSPNEFATVTFLPIASMRDPAIRRYEAIDGTKGNIQIVLQGRDPAGEPNCGCIGYRTVGDGHEIVITGSISKAEARKILDSLEVSTPGDFSTWVPVAEAIPEEYLYKGE